MWKAIPKTTILRGVDVGGGLIQTLLLCLCRRIRLRKLSEIDGRFLGAGC